MIVERGHLNGHVFFNLGNTCIRLGELGRAILNYKKASVLLPRDGDLKANLQYARSLPKTASKRRPLRSGTPWPSGTSE